MRNFGRRDQAILGAILKRETIGKFKRLFEKKSICVLGAILKRETRRIFCAILKLRLGEF